MASRTCCGVGSWATVGAANTNKPSKDNDLRFMTTHSFRDIPIRSASFIIVAYCDESGPMPLNLPDCNYQAPRDERAWILIVRVLWAHYAKRVGYFACISPLPNVKMRS